MDAANAPATPRLRRPGWRERVAERLTHSAVTPAGLSLLNLASGGFTMAAFIATRSKPWPALRAGFLLLAIVGLQLRRCCQLASDARAPTDRPGRIYTELLDCTAEVLIFAGVGICAGGTEGPLLGLGAGLACLLIRYVHALGGSELAAVMIGPMDAARRTAVLTAASGVGMVVVFFGRYLHAWMLVPLIVVCVGCVWTAGRSLRRIETASRAS